MIKRITLVKIKRWTIYECQFGEPKYDITKFVRANCINNKRPKVEQALKSVKAMENCFNKIVRHI